MTTAFSPVTFALPKSSRSCDNAKHQPLLATDGNAHAPTFSCSGLSEEETATIRAIGGPSADVYGEMTARGLHQFLVDEAQCQPASDTFLDLGSGKGALVVQAHEEFHLKKSMGIELSQERHDDAMALAKSRGLLLSASETTEALELVCGDAAGVQAEALLNQATLVWCSNLLFDDPLQKRLANVIGAHGTHVRMVASLKEFIGGIPGMKLQPCKAPLEMTWTKDKELPGHPPLPGHPCAIYVREER